MCNLLNPVIFISMIYSRYVYAGENQFCFTNYDFKNWKFDNQSPQPAKVLVGLTPHSDATCQQCLEVKITEVTENFRLLLYAIPYIKNKINCPSQSDLKKHTELLKHTTDYTPKKDDLPKAYRFRNIFTGCYYIVMRNNESINWITGPEFYETNFIYYNTNLTITRNTSIKPPDHLAPGELITELEIPKTCIGVQAYLFQTKRMINNITDESILAEIRRAKTTESRNGQECFAKYNSGGEGISSCIRSRKSTKPDLELDITEVNEKWRASIRWTKLPRSGRAYYLRFRPLNTYCAHPKHDEKLYDDRIGTWNPVVSEIICYLGCANCSRVQDPKSGLSAWKTVIFVSVVISAIAILGCFIFIFYRLPNPKHESNESSYHFQEIDKKCDENESNKILLIYAKDSSSFKRVMGFLRNHLQQTCNFHVHDLHAIDDSRMIHKLGASKWVEKLLNDGSKVIWVDTPRFRSYLNQEQNEFAEGDFREEVVRYTLSVAKDLFQDAITQYRRHFVVRVKGLEFRDGNGDEDPLRMISPHARFYIPDQLSTLCEQLMRGSKFHAGDEDGDLLQVIS